MNRHQIILSIVTLPILFTAGLSNTHAQVQQAGNTASTQSDATFQKLLEQCDDTDVLVLRGRIRVDINRTTEQAAATANQMLESGLTHCSNGELVKAREVLTEALAITKAGADERFAIQEQESAAAQKTDVSEPPASKPWWKFW